MNTDGNTAAIVAHRNGQIFVNGDVHRVGMACQCFVNAVIDNLIHHVVQTRSIVGITDVHAGTLANSLQAFENLDGIGAVFFWLLLVFGHGEAPCYFDRNIGFFVRNVTREAQDFVLWLNLLGDGRDLRRAIMFGDFKSLHPIPEGCKHFRTGAGHPGLCA